MSSDVCPRAGILESRPWIIIDQYSPFCRFASDSIGPRASFRKEPGRFARDMLWTTGPGPSGGLASAPGVRARATQFCPFIVKTGDFFFVVRAYRRFVWVLVQASIFLVLLDKLDLLGIFLSW